MKTKNIVLAIGAIVCMVTCAIGGGASFAGVVAGVTAMLANTVAIDIEKRRNSKCLGPIEVRVDLSDDQQTVTCCGRDYPAQPAIALWRIRKEEHIPFAQWFVTFYLPLLSWQQAGGLTTGYVPTTGTPASAGDNA